MADFFFQVAEPPCWITQEIVLVSTSAVDVTVKLPLIGFCLEAIELCLKLLQKLVETLMGVILIS